MNTRRRIYMDHAATTPVLPEVAEAMSAYLTETFGNPSSLHYFGQEAKRAVDAARDAIAATIGAHPSEIYFTSGGTESDNTAIRGVAHALSGRGKHIITSAIEHHAVLSTCDSLRGQGFSITLLPVDGCGLVDPSDVEKAITSDTVLVSVMHANNEIGTIEPIEEIAQITRAAGVAFHTDAVQTIGHMPIDVNRLGVDLLSMASHKFYGPKGVGAIYIRRGTRIASLIHGGAQERERRAGTENVMGIVGMSKALSIAASDMQTRHEAETALRDRLIHGLMDAIPETRLNGHLTNRLSNNANISIRHAEGESMLLTLDMNGVAVGSGSACSSGALEPSHVLKAIGVPFDFINGQLRFSVGRSTTEEDIDYIIDILPPIVARLRSSSPQTG